MSDLRRLRANWEAFGRQDPFWAILTLPGKRLGRWNVREFFETGVVEVDELMRRLEAIQHPGHRERALDFGCGVGRVTQALAGHFAEVVGVDIARSMLARARRLNGLGSRCLYVHNERPDLGRFPDGHFDLVYTAYVLQHMPPEYARGYVSEFIRVLRSDGVAVFQIPAARRSAPELPASAFRGRVAIASGVPSAMRAGSVHALTVTASNEGGAPWPARGLRSVSVGNHWKEAKGASVVVQDDARASFAGDLHPGASEDVILEVRAPVRPGRYLLEVDLVQEEVAWFAERGSAPERLPVRVRRRRPLPVRRPREEPHMDMYTVQPEEVRRWIEDSGGQLIEVWPLFSAGAGWALQEWDIPCYVAGPYQRRRRDSNTRGVD
ncbi:MAG TPA: methyltransferase domain-containing protein [Actinomycetota bacterium]